MQYEDGDDPVEYVPERLDIDDNAVEAFSDVFARFQLPPDDTEASVFPYCNMWNSADLVAPYRIQNGISPRAKLFIPTTTRHPTREATRSRKRPNPCQNGSRERWRD
jgi:hypothetical protein